MGFKNQILLNQLFGGVLRFLRLEAASGILLLICAVMAMVIANSDLAHNYQNLLNTKIGFLSLSHWINDGLMAIFFFLVGMEIKHELTDGALASFDRAALPVCAAVGGMLAPAAIFLLLHPGGESQRGWGIPMATDIAFAVGVLTLLGRRVPTELKVFLLALAIADDLGAVLVIAFFYTSGLKLGSLAIAVLLFGMIWYLGRNHYRWIALNLPLGVAAWWFVHEAGVHATIAGCVLGFLMPHDDLNPNDPTPLERWVARLHPWVSFGIMPIFALANAGVALGDFSAEIIISEPLVNAVSFGLFLGKPIGIFLVSWIAIKVGLASLPRGVSLTMLLGAGALGGIGFTMALFIANLALPNPVDLDLAKIGIIKGSLLSAALGVSTLLLAFRASQAQSQ
jgi:NhaA family Na+:H+ antiporter